MSWIASVAILVGLPNCQAGVELRPGTVIEFAGIEEGRRVLGERDGFIEAMSQFDRCMRMQTTRMVTDVELTTYLANQVRAWSTVEQTKVSNIVVSFRDKLAALDLPFPPRIPMIKTSGSDEGGAAYCRAGCVVLPQRYLSFSTQLLRDVVIHELFHIFSSHNPHRRPALYSIVGFFECGEITLPESLQPLRITNPDAFHNSFAILLRERDRTVAVLPVIYSRSAEYTPGGSLFDYLRFMLLELEFRDGQFAPVCQSDGQPQEVVTEAQMDYSAYIGSNSGMPIHPEEILADSFVLLVKETPRIGSPRLVHLLRSVLENRTRRWDRLPGGCYHGRLGVSPDSVCRIETSADMVEWLPYDFTESFNGGAEIVDREAWLSETRFYRARQLTELPPAPGDINLMVWVSPGSFTMGSPSTEDGGSSLEGPLTQVAITRGFWLGKYEVTRSEYATVRDANPPSQPGEGYLPAQDVTWIDATNYCARLTARVRAAGYLPEGYVYRLPTEAEWEYACRAGTSTAFSFGEDEDQKSIYACAWFSDNSENRPHPVGLKRANAWGFHDMHGNVNEWCADFWSDRLPGGTVENYAGPQRGTKRCYRGGHCQNGPNACRSASRVGINPDEPRAGFRVALAPLLP